MSAAVRQRRPLLASFGDWLGGPLRVVRRFAPAVLLAVLVALAFPFSAMSLWTGLQTDTPLAYQGLIPIVAFLTAVGQARRRPSYVWRDWVTEAIVAAPFLIAAVAMMYAGPRLGSIYFWLNRNDLLALACFGVAVSIVVFGVGAVFRSWFAVLYLFLLWPAPYRDSLAGIVDTITSATVVSLEWLLQQAGVSSIVPLGSAVFQITGPSGASVVGVDSPCSGASGIFGFLIIATPVLYLVSGRLTRKLGWLAGGIALLWLMNLLRIVVLFAIAARSGTDSSLFEWAHLSLGMVLFAIAMFVMTLVGYRLGFRFQSGPPAAMPSMLRIRSTRPASFSLVCVALVALFLGHLNTGMV
ncbi:MAG: archaeosortase/exosortase family protein, partial [Vicinamibacterales bacterium]